MQRLAEDRLSNAVILIQTRGTVRCSYPDTDLREEEMDIVTGLAIHSCSVKEGEEEDEEICGIGLLKIRIHSTKMLTNTV